MPLARAPRPLPPPSVPGRDDSPETLRRIRDELEACFAGLHAQLLAKERQANAASTGPG